MILHDLIVNSIQQASTDVFSTMLGVDIGKAQLNVIPENNDANDGVVSFIGLAGTWAGMGSLSCSAAMACRICSQMLMTESVAVNEEVLDAVAELTNMIIGCVKTELEGQLGPLGLSIPTVVFGRNFRTKSSGTTEWIVVQFLWDGEPLVIKLCLAPNERAPHLHHQAAQTCTLEI